jgi:hypothetical protein
MRVDVRAMQYEGWVALDERFDDLGVSAGNLERLALRRLLSWCVQGRGDVGARNAMVHALVWAAECDRELGLTRLVLDVRTNASASRASSRVKEEEVHQSPAHGNPTPRTQVQITRRHPKELENAAMGPEIIRELVRS